MKKGLFLSELAHPYLKFESAGYQLTIASVKGGSAPVDPDSLVAPYFDDETSTFYSNHKSEIENTAPLADFNGSDFDVVFYVGGFGTMHDFPHDSHVIRIGEEVFINGGVLSAVCHGPSALINMKINGEYLLKSRNVTGFTNDEESQVGIVDNLPHHEGLGRSLEDIFTARGATFHKGDPWSPKVVQDGKLFTGQNPGSANQLADAIIASL